jgi:ABC-type multidrug transport system fused ATPase/permease subunit
MRSKHRLADFYAMLHPHRARLIGLALLTVVLSVLAMLPPLLTRAILDQGVVKGNHAILPVLGLLLLCLPALTTLCGYLQVMGITFVGQKFVFELRQSLYKHLLGLGMRFHGESRVGMMANRLLGDSDAIQRVLTSQTLGIVSDFISSLFALSVMFAIHWRMGLLLLLFLFIFVLNFKGNISSIRMANRSYQRSMDRLSAGLQNRLSINLAIKSHGSETREHGVFSHQLDLSLDQANDLAFSNNRFWRNTELLAEIGRASIYFLGCGMVLAGRMSYGDVLAFTSYAVQLLWPAVRFSLLAKQIQDVQVASDRLLEIWQEVPDIVNRPGAVEVGRLRGEVHFEQVAFHYKPGTPVLRNFSLQVKPGQTVALIGPTGCGKSTVLSLLMRFFDVCGGTIRIDGIDLRDMRLSALRRQFGIVLQEPLLFTASIADNIRYARPSATREEIEQAARVAEIHDFIQTLKDGYETVIGVEGAQLSVGQKQRITIARAVAADPALLIMDEATSSLDSESERAIQIAMERVLRGRTAFIVAHRLSTIRNADWIVLMKDGGILEQGTHAELVALNGSYAATYRTFMGQGSPAEGRTP